MNERSGPKAAPQTPAKKSDQQRSSRYTPPPPDPEYDALVDLEGYESDPLTADEWGAICLAESRDVALAEVAE